MEIGLSDMRDAMQEKTCPVCRKPFMPKSKRVKCCSRRCRALKQWGRTIDGYKPPEESSCGECYKVSRIYGRGLCFRCYHTPEIRVKHPKMKTGSLEGVCRPKHQKDAYGLNELKKSVTRLYQEQLAALELLKPLLLGIDAFDPSD